eukprot:360342-Chlamydomonas_euryale.AAC.1
MLRCGAPGRWHRHLMRCWRQVRVRTARAAGAPAAASPAAVGAAIRMPPARMLRAEAGTRAWCGDAPGGTRCGTFCGGWGACCCPVQRSARPRSLAPAVQAVAPGMAETGWGGRNGLRINPYGLVWVSVGWCGSVWVGVVWCGLV